MRSRSAQALVEVMVAISILAVGFLGIITLLSQALGLNRVVSDNYVATYLAAEGIEVTKNIIDANYLQGQPWNAGLSNGTYEVEYNSLTLEPSGDRYLDFDPSTNLYDYEGTQVTPYQREVTVTLISQNEVQVNSEVTWLTRGGGISNINLEDHFFNWR